MSIQRQKTKYVLQLKSNNMEEALRKFSKAVNHDVTEDQLDYVDPIYNYNTSDPNKFGELLYVKYVYYEYESDESYEKRVKEYNKSIERYRRKECSLCGSKKNLKDEFGIGFICCVCDEGPLCSECARRTEDWCFCKNCDIGGNSRRDAMTTKGMPYKESHYCPSLVIKHI